jgi:hypothetical protein
MILRGREHKSGKQDRATLGSDPSGFPGKGTAPGPVLPSNVPSRKAKNPAPHRSRTEFSYLRKGGFFA